MGNEWVLVIGTIYLIVGVIICVFEASWINDIDSAFERVLIAYLITGFWPFYLIANWFKGKGEKD